MLLALNSHRQYFLKQEQIYQCQDFSNHIFLVASGVFAYIGVPKETGGEDVNTISAGMGRWLAAVRVTVGEQTQTNTYPYQLFCRDSYFGEYGVLFNQPREATARCEARGSCIVVPKAEMERSTVDFPEFSRLWNSVAASREKMRISMRKRLTLVAATNIWQHFAYNEFGVGYILQSMCWPKTGMMTIMNRQQQPSHRSDLQDRCSGEYRLRSCTWRGCRARTSAFQVLPQLLLAV